MKIVLYTNILTPYRKYFFDLFYKECKKCGDDFIVLVMAETEKNRSWHYKEFQTRYTKLLEGKTISIKETYIHINPKIVNELKKIRPDVVIASGSYLCPGTWKIARLKKKLHYKVYFWSESHLGEARQYGGLKIILREKIRKIFYRKFDGFLCPGKLAFDFVGKYRKEKVNEILLPNLVDESIFSNEIYKKDILCEQLHSKGKVIFFTPARLSEVKGIEPFMELLGKVKNKDQISWIIAGSGSLYDKLREKAKELSLNVIFVGEKKQEEISDLYKNSDVFVLPSLSDPNPLTCVEALWSKKVLLVSNHVGNYPEVISQGENGYMFSYENKKEAMQIIETVASKDYMWRLNAGKKSYEIATYIYDSQKTVVRVRKELCK